MDPFRCWFKDSHCVLVDLDRREEKANTSRHMKSELKIDEIGYWSEIKLSILDEYARPYNQITHAKRFKTTYIDAFAGAGHHLSKTSARLIEGSPVRAMNVDPPFDFLHFVDIDEARVKELRRLAGDRKNVQVHRGDCNEVLLTNIFPKVRYDHYERALCILDPYGLHLDWQVIEAAGKSKTTEIFLNFPVMDMNMNVFWANPEGVTDASSERMTRFWGDDSWKGAAYSTVPGLFGEMEVKNSIDQVTEAFRKRLKQVAGFGYVPSPMPMRNTKGAIVYFLFFAAQKPISEKIVKDIFEKYYRRGEVPNG
jgi:three-Cys-motif partner protein